MDNLAGIRDPASFFHRGSDGNSLIDAEAKFPREAAIPYNLACYYCQLGEIEKAKRYLKKAFEIDLNWRKAALDDEDLRPLWDLLQTTVE